MRKYRILSCAFLSAAAFLLCGVTASANSSWIWISETRPYDILPWVVLITLVVETVCVDRIPQVNRGPKTFCVVAAANIVSFAAPYLLKYLSWEANGFGFEKYLDHAPSYIVGIAYGLLTVAVELPIVYNALKKDAPDRKKLLVTAIAVNVVTTVIVACFERALCQGQW